MSKPYIIKPPERFLAIRHLDCFSEEVGHSRRKLPVHIDLSDVAFIRPLAVVAVVVFMEKMLSRHRRLLVSFPHRLTTFQYLLSIGLPTIMDSLADCHWPQDFPTSAPRGLRPMIKLAKFSTPTEVDRISEQMAQEFEAADEVPANLRMPCHQVFSELADNVVNHADAPGYVVAQRFEYKEGPVIDIAVGDCGIGIRDSLWQKAELRPRLGDDAEALLLAMEDGVTTLSDPYRGFGLGYVNRELSARGRSLVVRSGEAAVSWKEGKPFRTYAAGPSVGTLAHAMIPC